MIGNNTIRYLQRNEIDSQRWDECITGAANGLIYAYSFYLDKMARNWHALVLNDYEVVMPLTWNRKYTLSYLYQPAFTASLGVFGNNLDQSMVTRFIQAIPDRFRLIEIELNAGNLFTASGQFARIRNNYVLNIQRPYGEIQAGFRDNVKRNSKKARQAGCIYNNNIAVNEVIALACEQMAGITKVTEADYQHFASLFDYLRGRQQAMACGVYTPTGQLVASCVYFFSHNRAYYILVGNHPNSKVMGASHYLVDCFIKEQAGKEWLLDFEGSDIRNLAFFYSSFGAHAETYPSLRINRLPWWARWKGKLAD